MEKLARKLASEISKSLGYDEEKTQVIAYGLIAIIQAIVTVSLVLLGGLIAGTPVEALIICFSISILRKYSGGAHVSSIELCTALGTIYCIIFSSISKYLLTPILNTYIFLFIIAAAYTLSFLAIFKLAPVDSPNKPIKSEKKK
jgi:accessory gene regulator B